MVHKFKLNPALAILASMAGRGADPLMAPGSMQMEDRHVLTGKESSGDDVLRLLRETRQADARGGAALPRRLRREP
jgi:hypothetical protein